MRRLLRKALCPVGTLSALLVANHVLAQSPPNTQDVSSEWSADRPHTMAEVALGALSVPRATLCLPTEVSCSKITDLTFLVALQPFFQINRRFALGASIGWGIRPVSDDASIPSAFGIIGRSHTRNYFLLAPVARYYPLAQEGFDVWVGATGGLVIISDRYKNDQPGTSIVGPQATTIGTEGGMLGVGLGVDWRISLNWSFGLWTQEMFWLLPAQADCAATQECATLQGKVFTLETGLSVTYRLRL